MARVAKNQKQRDGIGLEMRQTGQTHTKENGDAD